MNPGLDLAAATILNLLTNLALGRGEPSGSSYSIIKISLAKLIVSISWFLAL
jgi:hypothetical protein